MFYMSFIFKGPFSDREHIAVLSDLLTFYAREKTRLPVCTASYIFFLSKPNVLYVYTYIGTCLRLEFLVNN